MPEREQRKLARVPANARLVSFVPLTALVARFWLKHQVPALLMVAGSTVMKLVQAS